MAPQKPRSRPTSAQPSPTKTPRQSTDRRKSGSPTKRASGTTENRRSTAEKRESYTSDNEKRRSAASSRRRSSPKKVTATINSGPASSTALSADSLARLDAQNDKDTRNRRSRDKVASGRVDKEKKRKRKEGESREKRARPRIAESVSEKFAHRGGWLPQDRKKRRFLCLGVAFFLLLIIILVPVGVLVVGKQNNLGNSSSTNSQGGPNNSNLNGVDVPAWAKGTYYDPFTWYDTADFNVTVTNATVGGLPIMGLNDTWDDTTQANPNVPPLNKKFAYGTTPIRGVNVGGWLSLEPFITPSFFSSYGSSRNVVDEWTLTQTLGPGPAATQLEKHYSSFINGQTFADIRNAGFDHVRMPFSYWAVVTYPGDPYVPMISWRYLLRGIEYARQNGLRVNLDLHGVPGSQNGWNHSGRQGVIGWLNGTDGTLNGQRSLDIHNQLSQFFAQDRYKNVVGIYGLVNEPKMISLPTQTVLDWTTQAISIVRKNGITQAIAFGDGFLGIPNWQGKLQGIEGLVMDAHQYTIFNIDQIAFNHQTKLSFSCSGWAGQMELSTNTATGFGPTMCGEWSQADTDCAPNLNNVGVGSRWEGTMNLPDPSSAVLQPCCPLKTSACSCTSANADPSTYSDEYKQWLLWNALAQMNSFEIGWGWFYWTWLTESATQWSWKLGMDAGILPAKVWDRSAFNCSQTIPDFSKLGLPENYR